MKMRKSGFVTMMLWLMAALPMVAAGDAVEPGEEVSPKDVEKVLRTLDREITQRDRYLDVKHARIDSLKKLINREKADTLAMVCHMLCLGNLYSAVNNDSAISCFTRGARMAHRIGADSLATLLRLRSMTYLPLAGYNFMAEREFAAIDTLALPQGLLPAYYDAGRQLYSYMSSFYNGDSDTFVRARLLSHENCDRLLQVLAPNDPAHQLYLGEHYIYLQDLQTASEILTPLLASLDVTDNLYARAAHNLSTIAQQQGRFNEHLYYLALSAIADIRGATLEVSALQQLGRLMYDRMDTQRAYAYLSEAQRNAVECGAMARIIESSRSMPLIESAHNLEMERSRHRLSWVAMTLACAVIVMVTLMVYLRRENRRQMRLQANLSQANHVKEIYLSQFLKLCSLSMEKLQQFGEVVERKITTGNVDDLLKMSLSGRYVEDQSREFHNMFDEAFLRICPGFVEQVNALLTPQGQVVLREGERLNTDLRILALMRLGIEETPRIARFLNYTVNTIYTYRHKLRKRALNHDTFEADVMKIKV